MTLMELVHLEFVANVAAHDVGIAIWQEKIKWNAVRPFSALAKLYPNTCTVLKDVELFYLRVPRCT